MIGLPVLSAFFYIKPDSMYSDAFDVLIKNLEGFLTSNYNF